MNRKKMSYYLPIKLAKSESIINKGKNYFLGLFGILVGTGLTSGLGVIGFVVRISSLTTRFSITKFFISFSYYFARFFLSFSSPLNFGISTVI